MTENQIYVSNLSLRTNVDQLKSFIETVAPVENVLICSRKGRSLRFGFVTLKNPNDRSIVCSTLSGKPLNGFDIKIEPYEERPRGHGVPSQTVVQPAQPHQSRPQANAPRVPSTKTIRITNLPSSATQEQLTDVFKDFGVDFVVCRGHIRGGSMIGFVHFQDESGQKAALAQKGQLTLHGIILNMEAALERETA
ncbi:hypothetical protein BLNAU_11287 [Blattamonas nauphoetae]|uniref:RRM domain-containing protein n=1 Tax=Blattamonas nauphoetae TaxID=2049346 RepID=A0ABQ9XR43_9EUKA|nr:hypothetical protein BLNAU_11287 [Blattamonas nauphoetae]